MPVPGRMSDERDVNPPCPPFATRTADDMKPHSCHRITLCVPRSGPAPWPLDPTSRSHGPSEMTPRGSRRAFVSPLNSTGLRKAPLRAPCSPPMLLPFVCTLPILVAPAAEASETVPNLASLATVILTTQVEAPDERRFDYDYAQAEVLLADLSGVRLRGSLDLQQNAPVFLTGSLNVSEIDDSNADLTLLSLGATYVFDMDAAAYDLLATAELEYGDIDLDTPFGSRSDDDLGIRVRGGGRYALGERLEGFGGIAFSTVFDEANDFTLDAGARYQFDNQFAAQASIEVGDELTYFTIGGRYSY